MTSEMIEDELIIEDGRAYCPVDDCDWWVPAGMEYAYCDHRQTHTDDFDSQAFVDWLDEQDGPIPAQTITDQWPCFPWHNLTAVTGTFVDGEPAYYKRDLERAARGKQPID